MKKENWELTMSMEAVEELEEMERKVLRDEDLIRAYYEGKLNRAQKRVANLKIKHRIKILGHK